MLYLSDDGVAIDQASTGEASSFNVTFTYDPAGNRSVREVDGSLTTYTYDDANRLLAREAAEGITTYTLDAAGNPLEKQAPDGTTYYAWDGLNRMVEAEPPTFAGAITFDYNALGQRMTKVLPGGEQKRFIYDFQKLLQESDDTDDPQQTYTATVDEYGDLLSEHDDQSDSALYHQYDAQMNTEALLDGDGDVAACYKYSAFGNLAMAGASAAGWSDLTPGEWSGMSVDDWSDLPLAGSQSLTTAGFGGGMFYYRDQETQLFLLGAGNRTGAGGRYYDPELGRFMSDDPLRFNAGDLNLLRYVGNNPVNRSDPSGNQGGIFGIHQSEAGKQGVLEKEFQEFMAGERTTMTARGGVGAAYIMNPEDRTDPDIYVRLETKDPDNYTKFGGNTYGRIPYKYDDAIYNAVITELKEVDRSRNQKFLSEAEHRAFHNDHIHLAARGKTPALGI